jgi:transposase-like protein
MPKSHVPYPEEFRQQILELVRAGRSPEELAQEFEPTAQRSATGSDSLSWIMVSGRTV